MLSYDSNENRVHKMYVELSGNQKWKGYEGQGTYLKPYGNWYVQIGFGIMPFH